MDSLNESNDPLPQFPRVRLSLVGVLLAGGLAACAWSVPADPGAFSRLRGTPWATAPAPVGGIQPAANLTTGSDAGAQALYLDHCGRCHAPFAPNIVGAGDWPRYVQRYGPRAGLFGEDRARVLRWLQANAR